jgi:hypothetical protein
MFLWHFPSSYPDRTLSCTLPDGARTFLNACTLRRPGVLRVDDLTGRSRRPQVVGIPFSLTVLHAWIGLQPAAVKQDVDLTEGARRGLVRTFPAAALVWRFYRDLKRIPNLVRPRTFNEKILVRMLRERDERFVVLQDKLAAREYVRERLGSDRYLPVLYEAVPSAQDVLTIDLPSSFAMKPNHLSGAVRLVHEGENVERNELAAPQRTISPRRSRRITTRSLTKRPTTPAARSWVLIRIPRSSTPTPRCGTATTSSSSALRRFPKTLRSTRPIRSARSRCAVPTGSRGVIKTTPDRWSHECR